MAESKQSTRIYLSPPDVRGREKTLLLDALDSNWLAPLGPHVDTFEGEISTYLGGGHACALSSGTAALHLALLIVGVKPGDSVVCSSFTFVATANAITYAGASPIFVDSDRETWNLCPKSLKQALDTAQRHGRLPKAIIVVDLYGHSADYDKIAEVALQYKVPIIEDAAEALGATYKDQKVGRLGSVGIFSFNGNKIITTSGGGMLVSDNLDWSKRARHLATQARMPVTHYEHEEIGYNYRLSNILAALGRAQLETLDERIALRQSVRAHYKRAFANIPGIEFMPEPEYGTSNAWLTCVLIDQSVLGATRDSLIKALEEQNIESRPLWKPMHLQPAFSRCESIGGSVSEDLFRRGLCLPSGSDLSTSEVERIVSIIGAVRETS